LDAAMRAYADAQLISYETTHGWFYWTYKIASGGAWSFRDAVARGWMPDTYATRRSSTTRRTPGAKAAAVTAARRWP
ncbi:MAG TPA: hypothetical protein VKT77_22705, partial [Chthonomonadaceae bacterium]|nr:hypothetical protein [Chthonomonadaceae bacterium]